jgi:peptidoglycan/xylan/chitin deacetylase (PgdA/CDA1 family)
MFDQITEKLFSGDKKNNIVRRLPNERREIYLTFDDGPHEEFTPQVLEVLKECGAKATFFVIAKKAQAQAALISKIIEDGHRLGNHSVDHSYSALFLKGKALKDWIQSGETILQQLSGKASVGFRSPNGVVTPPLMEVLAELRQPLVLWTCRFFDTLVPWHEAAAFKALQKLKSGDIILLHDRLKYSRRSVFLQTLKRFILKAQGDGWKFVSLPENIQALANTGDQEQE